MTSQLVRIDLSPTSRAYDILVGDDVLAEAGGLVRARLGVRRAVIVTDNVVAPLYQQRLEAVLAAAGHMAPWGCGALLHGA